MASSSRPASVAGSDNSSTAAGSVTSDADTTYTVVVPYTGPVGSIYTWDTLPEDFSDWPVYLSFCENGPTLQLQCVDTIDDDGTPVHFNQMSISKKLLCDHSQYFKVMLRNEFAETKTGTVQFVDVLQEELMRVKLILMAGTPKGRINIGKLEEEMSNLVRTFVLLDRFEMPKMMEWMMVRITDFLDSHCNWMETYRREVLKAPAVSTITTAKENFHRAKLLDLCKAYTMLVALPPQARPVPPIQLVTLIAEYCHPLLLRSMMRNIDQEVWFAIAEIILTKI